MISALVLTKNEQCNIRRCLSSLQWCSDIVVLDSCSTDQTVTLARQLGATVVQRPFDDWSSHQNWAVANIRFRYEWVLYLDADEECDDTLTQELSELAHPNSRMCHFAALRVRRKDFFMGRWLKHAQMYPTWITRVFKPPRVRFERLVNPVAKVDGQVGKLTGHILHQPFSHGVAHWFARHNSYSDFEAQELVKEVSPSPDWRGLFSQDTARRRKILKRLAYSIPARPLWMLAYLLILRRGFLDGVPGVYYCAMRAAYELMIDVKVRELRWRRSDSSSPSLSPAKTPNA